MQFEHELNQLGAGGTATVDIYQWQPAPHVRPRRAEFAGRRLPSLARRYT